MNQDSIDLLISRAEKKELLTIDLQNQRIIQEDGIFEIFEVDSFRKRCLLEGLDDISLTLEKSLKIDEYESRFKTITPWISE